MPHYNYIIIGQGLAGTVLAHTLLSRGHSVLVIDDDNSAAASRVAAGLCNPIVPKRLAKSWKVDELLPVMTSFYSEIGKKLGDTFFYQGRMLKPFAQEQEKAQWIKKIQEEVGEFLGRDFFTDDLDGLIHNPLGAAEILSTGYLNMLKFLSRSRTHFGSMNAILSERFDHSQLQINTDGVSYKGNTAGKLIFCEGAAAKSNPWFSWADYRLTKGEVLIIELPDGKRIPPDLIINKGVFILYIGNNQYKVGATFNWEDMTTAPTEKAREELVEKLQKVLKVPFEIIAQEAGIRPTMNDRRPILGLHPEYRVLGIFNGLGTKGVMMAPYFALHLAGFLEDRHPLDPEVDISRFKS